MPTPVKVDQRETGSDGAPYLSVEENRLKHSVGCMERSLNDVEASLKERFRQLVTSQLSLLRYCEHPRDTIQVSVNSDNSNMIYENVISMNDEYITLKNKFDHTTSLNDDQRCTQSADKMVVFQNESIQQELPTNELSYKKSKQSPNRSLTYRAEIVDRRPKVHFTPPPKFKQESKEQKTGTTELTETRKNIDQKKIHEIPCKHADNNVTKIDMEQTTKIKRNNSADRSPQNNERRNDICETTNRLLRRPTVSPYRRDVSKNLPGQSNVNKPILKYGKNSDKYKLYQDTISGQSNIRRIRNFTEKKGDNFNGFKYDNINSRKANSPKNVSADENQSTTIISPRREVKVESEKTHYRREVKVESEKTHPRREVKVESEKIHHRREVKVETEKTHPRREVKVESEKTHFDSIYKSKVPDNVKRENSSQTEDDTKLQPELLKEQTTRRLKNITKEVTRLAEKIHLANCRNDVWNTSPRESSHKECQESDRSPAHRKKNTSSIVTENHQMTSPRRSPNHSPSPAGLQRSPVVMINIKEEVKTTHSCPYSELPSTSSHAPIATMHLSYTENQPQKKQINIVGGVADVLSYFNDALKDSTVNGIDRVTWKGIQQTAMDMDERITNVCSKLVSTTRLIPETQLRNAENRIQIQLDRLFEMSQNNREINIQTSFMENMQHDLFILKMASRDIGEVSQCRKLLGEMRNILAGVYTMTERLQECGERFLRRDARDPSQSKSPMREEEATNQSEELGSLNMIQHAAQALVPYFRISPETDVEERTEKGQHRVQHSIFQHEENGSVHQTSSTDNATNTTVFVFQSTPIKFICSLFIIIALGIAVGWYIASFGHKFTDYTSEILRKLRIFWCCLIVCYRNAPLV